MPFKTNQLVSFRKREVYKTEFDIFKRSTDIDLLSLVSYNGQDDQSRSDRIKAQSHRPKSYSQVERRQCVIRSARSAQPKRTTQITKVHRPQTSRNSTLSSRYHRIDSAYKTRNSKIEINKDLTNSARKSVQLSSTKISSKGRLCKSALGVRGSSEDSVRLRSHTACGFRNGAECRIIRARANIDKPNANTKNLFQNKPRLGVNKNRVTSVNKAWQSQDSDTYSNKNQQTNSPQCKSQQDHLECRTGLSDQKQLVLLVDNDGLQLPEESRGLETFSVEENDALQRVVCKTDTLNIKETGKITLDTDAERVKVTNECDSQIDIESTSVNEIEDNAKVNAEILDKETEDRTQQIDQFTSKDSGIDIHAGPTPDYLHSSSTSESTSQHDRDTDDKRVKFFDEESEQLMVPENTEDLQFDSVSNADVPLIDITSETSDQSEEVDAKEYNVNDLIKDLERLGNQSRLSTFSVGVQSTFAGVDDTNSLCCDSSRDVKKPEIVLSEHQVETIQTEQSTLTLDDITMSKEARHAILETLNEMGIKRSRVNKENIVGESFRRSVSLQKRQKENRHKYDHYLRERTNSILRSRLKSLDSLGNEDDSSRYSSPRNGYNCDECSNEETNRGKMFPSIGKLEKPVKAISTATEKSKVYSLEQVKKKQYKIPGIGHYNLVTSPESDFEITPPGFDSRYNPRPIISKEEQELPPRFIRERSIQKCKKWLDGVNFLPMTLKSVTSKKHGQS